MLLGVLLKGKKLLRKRGRGRQQGCGEQGRRGDGGTPHGSGSLFFLPSFPVWFVVLHLQLVKLHGRNVQLGALAKLVSIWVKPEVLEWSLLGRVGDSH